MSRVLEGIDKSGKKIYLTEERWKHINREHPEVASNPEKLREALLAPLKITQNEHDPSIHYYYKHHKQQSRYLVVIG